MNCLLRNLPEFRVRSLLGVIGIGWVLAIPLCAQEIDFGTPVPLAPAETPPGAAGLDQLLAGPPVSAEAQQAYDRGKQLADQGQCAEAIELFSQALAVDSRLVPAYLERGKCFAELKMYDLALQSLSQAVSMGQQFPETFAERGKVLLEIGQYREAADDFEQAIQLNPSEPEYFYQHGKALFRLAAATMAAGPQAAQTHFAAAVRSLDRAVELRPDHAEAHYFRGRANTQLGQLDEAIADLQQASRLEPENFDYVAHIGYAFLQRGNRQAAARVKDEPAIRADYRAANDAFSRYLTGQEKVGDGTEAVTDPSAADDTVKIEDVYVARAVTEISLASHSPAGEREALYQAAIRDCQGALQQEPDLTVALFHRGLAQRMLEEYPSAIRSFTEVLEVSPDFAEALLRRGIVWFHLDELDPALQDFEAALEASGDSRAAFWAGLAHAYKGEYDLAVDAYTLALRGNSAYTLAYQNRGLAFLKLGLYELAIRDFNEVIRRNPSNAAAFFRRGVAYGRRGKREVARRSFEKALQLDPGYVPAQRALSRF